MRPIREAKDALSPVEQRVYGLLWNASDNSRTDFHLVHYSLQRVASEAHINIRTVRELIPRLIEKGFLRIEAEADVRRNIATLYRVLGPESVLADQRGRNRFHVARTGKGIVYAHPVAARFRPQKQWHLVQDPWVTS